MHKCISVSKIKYSSCLAFLRLNLNQYGPPLPSTVKHYFTSICLVTLKTTRTRTTSHLRTSVQSFIEQQWTIALHCIWNHPPSSQINKKENYMITYKLVIIQFESHDMVTPSWDTKHMTATARKANSLGHPVTNDRHFSTRDSVQRFRLVASYTTSKQYFQINNIIFSLFICLNKDYW